ncbi:hypothetical protein KCU77_g8179, partial [Aureobasidium melanogenum]
MDGPAAIAAGFSTPEEVAEARYLGLLPAGLASPSVVYEVDRHYLNQMKTQPTPFGHWRFLSDGPGSVAEQAAVNYGGNIDIDFEHIPAPSVVQIWEVRQGFVALGRYSSEKHYFAQGIELVWIPAVSLGQQRIQKAQEPQRSRSETRRHIAEARARADRDRRCIAEERAIAAETRLRTRRNGPDTSSELNRRRIAQDVNPIIGRNLPPFRYQGPEHTNTREPKINTDTLTNLITRQNFDVDVSDPVQVDRLAYKFAISFGRCPNDQTGYPTHNMTFVTSEGVVIGTYNEDGQVWDLKRNYLGSLMSMDVD